jgi:hypothetical protein
MPFLFYACRTALLTIVVALVSACSSNHPYAGGFSENLSIAADVRAGRARLHVFAATNACKPDYLGTVELSEKKSRIGLPVNRPIYLSFNFFDGSLITGSNDVYYDMYLTLRAGYQYQADVNYIDNMYGATIFEQDGRGGAKRKIPHAELPCARK